MRGWRAGDVLPFLLAPAMSAVAACSAVGLLNAAAPRDGITTTLDVPYAAGPRHGLDIFAPSGAGLPVVVFIYGGGWKDGSKSMYRFVGATLANRGFVTVIPDYRVFPQVRFPDFLRDTARAMAWTKANIARYGGDPNRVSLMGHSAGAHIAAMLTLDRQWLIAVGLDPDRDIDAMIGLSGPYDFLPLHDPELDLIFAPARDLRRTQQIAFARGGCGADAAADRNRRHDGLPAQQREPCRAGPGARRPGGCEGIRRYRTSRHYRGDILAAALAGADTGRHRCVLPSA
jgi:acetyl esterase/lipase